MLFSAVSSSVFFSASRRSITAPRMLALSTASVTPAMVSASVDSEKASAPITRVGSGMSSTAPMAVK